MIKYVSVEEMRAVEREADQLGLTYAQMMEHAGKNLGVIIERELGSQTNRSALGLVGSGNNGGDTLVALAYLAECGWKVIAYLVKERNSEDPLIQRVLERKGIILSHDKDEELKELKVALSQSDVLLDGVLGTGFQLPLKGNIGKILKFVKETIKEKDTHTVVVAVDCPSGVDCDRGEVAEEVIPANLTVIMAAVKAGLLKFPAYPYCGQIVVADIGLSEAFPTWNAIHRFVIDAEWVKAKLPQRSDDSHKGTYGTTFILAGSEDYTGAALLTAKAAYLSGCGLVTVGAVRAVHHSLAGQIPEATWKILPDQDGFLSASSIELLRDRLSQVEALIFGPGFGLHASTASLVESLINQGQNQLPPLVVDADGLKLMAQKEGWHDRIPKGAVLTPHPGEMSVMTGMSVAEVQAARIAVAEQFANQWGQIVVLKGAFTVIAEPNGRTAINPVATSALARAGSGDVLAGLIGGFRAQGLEGFEAAVLGVWVHAQAGLKAASKKNTTRCILASDVLEAIPQVLADIENR